MDFQEHYRAVRERLDPRQPVVVASITPPPPAPAEPRVSDAEVEVALATTYADRRPTLNLIVYVVSRHFFFEKSFFVGPSRLRKVARPRQIAMYLSTVMTGRTHTAIGREFGRDRTTIRYGHKEIREMLDAGDEWVSKHVTILRRKINRAHFERLEREEQNGLV